MSEFRRDPVTGRWVIISPGRVSRPRHLGSASGHFAAAQSCPFCAGNEAMTPAEVWAERESDAQANSPDWRVRVVPNKYPALIDGTAWRGEEKDSFQRSITALGVHEVIIESPEHVVNMARLSSGQINSILRAYCARLRQLRQDRRWRFLLVYKNHGERAGATLEHIHSQLAALPFVPREAHDEMSGIQRYFEACKRCIYCDLIRRESEDHKRVVLSSPSFIAFCPFASRFAYETWIIPQTHSGKFERSSEAEIVALADCLHAILVKLNSLSANPSFNLVIHTAPSENFADQHYHWHLQILPQITRAAGFEWGTGVHMNSISPEEAARSLRTAPG